MRPAHTNGIRWYYHLGCLVAPRALQAGAAIEFPHSPGSPELQRFGGPHRVTVTDVPGGGEVVMGPAEPGGPPVPRETNGHIFV